jgi:hypothetical protein
MQCRNSGYLVMSYPQIAQITQTVRWVVLMHGSVCYQQLDVLSYE